MNKVVQNQKCFLMLLPLIYTLNVKRVPEDVSVVQRPVSGKNRRLLFKDEKKTLSGVLSLKKDVKMTHERSHSDNFFCLSCLVGDEPFPWFPVFLEYVSYSLHTAL